MTRPELLSPVGDLTAVRAAISNGADAVYLGAQAFGARASKGFSDEDLKQAIDLAHLHACRVFVTVNTLIKPQEFTGLIKLLHKLDEFKADALIVQDLGLIRYARKHLPHLPLHASTQMSIHNAWGARLLQRMGVTRVVAARECPLPVLRAISDTGIETEAFVHGALCVSQSGQCLLSSMIGGRSGNRGRCAQPCRMPYTVDGKEAAWLSPRDICLIDQIGLLAENGVTSFKIEGRLKRPEYVAVVTDVFRRAIDHAMDASRPPAPTEEDRRALLQIFNRGGFSQGYVQGGLHTEAQIMNPARVSHEGVLMGHIVSTAPRAGVFLSRLRLQNGLHDGDHLQIRGADEQEMIYSGPAVNAGQEVTIRHHRPAAGNEAAYRLTDAAQMQAAQAIIDRTPSAVPVDMELLLEPGMPSRLQLSANGVEVNVTGADALPARAQPLTAGSASRALAKTGGTPFALGGFALHEAAPSFLPVSALNALRRDGLAALEEALLRAHRRPRADAAAPDPIMPAFPGAAQPRLWVRTPRASDLPVLREAGAEQCVYLPPDYDAPSLRRAFADAKRAGALIGLPGQCPDRVLDEALALSRTFGSAMLLDNVGQLAPAWPCGFIAGNGIPAWNADSLRMLEALGAGAVVLPRELSAEEVAALRTACPAGQELILPVYGRARAMTLNHCPARLRAGVNADQACRRCRELGGHGVSVSDQFGCTYPLQSLHLPEGCLHHLLFHTPLHLGADAPRMSWLLDMTCEDTEQAARITRYYRALMDGGAPPALTIPEHLGRWRQGVQ